MKITCISDTHGYHEKVKTSGGDILIFAGDWQANHESDPDEFVYWITGQNYEDIIIVRGNHDNNYSGLSYACKATKIHLLHDSEIRINGINFYGTPWCPQYMNWSYMAEEHVLERIFELIPRDTNILISHSPAYGILDNSFWGNIGSRALYNEIHHRPDYSQRIKYHIFGHIHEAYGTKKVWLNNEDYYMAINASQVNLNYQLVNKPIDFEYEDL